MYSLLIFLVILGIIVFVHELGHFIAAKRSGMRVDEFGFGFPPRIFGIKRGGTIYSINLIPLGGFVKIKGENGEDASEGDSFGSKSIPRRIFVILAGVTMNIILAFVLFTFGFMVGMPQAIDVPPSGAIVSEETVRVGGILPGSPADKAGLKSGDIVERMNGASVDGSESLRANIRGSEGDIEFKIKRDKVVQDVKVSPEVLKETNVRGIGVELIDVGTVRFPWYLAPIKGAHATVLMLWSIVVSFYTLLAGLIMGKGLSSDVSGPVGIAVITGEAAKIGFRYLIEFTALLSLNLAVVNAVPFPALDGGRFLFLIIETLRGRAVSRKIEGIAHQVGFTVLMLLIVAVTYRDLVRYSGAIVSFFKGIF